MNHGWSDRSRHADAEVNLELWTRISAEFTDARADEMWRDDRVSWGIFEVPEDDVGVLGDVAGLDVLELGCGTAYFAARLARRGAGVVGVDLTPAQLATAARCQRTHGPSFPLICADGEDVPLASGSFDLVVSEYGASLWCEPAGWVAEAARLLRPGGRLVFLTSSVLVTLCVPEEGGYAVRELQREQRGKYRVEWPGGGVEYHPSHSDWIRILSTAGFAVEGLHELYAPPGATTPPFYEIAEPAWASRWPVEDLWAARLR